MHLPRKVYAGAGALALIALGVTGVASAATGSPKGDGTSNTATPIKHLVVIYQENVSFDHYFGTYP
ncbi:MAG: phospholipase, partial [Actinobacteria bacterium]|nr:phospholipase [Actinomycetota bacterium]